MSENTSPIAINSSKPKRSKTRAVLIVAVLATVVLVPALFWLRGGSNTHNHVTFAVRRGTLEIKVLEGGNLKAIESPAR